MTNITEHDAEQEGECNDCKNTWVNFLVGRNTVSVDDFLENPCDLIEPKETWRSYTVILDNFQCRDIDIAILIFETFNLTKNCLVIGIWDPAETEVESIFNLKLIQSRVK